MFVEFTIFNAADQCFGIWVTFKFTAFTFNDRTILIAQFKCRLLMRTTIGRVENSLQGCFGIKRIDQARKSMNG